MEPLGVDWVRPPEGPRPKVAYSQDAVEVFDRAALIAKSSSDAAVGVNHLLAAFAADESGLMGDLKRAHGIPTRRCWRPRSSRIRKPTLDRFALIAADLAGLDGGGGKDRRQ